jgi:hypothetical protein
MRLRRCLPFAVLTNVLILTDDSPNRHGRACPVGLQPTDFDPWASTLSGAAALVSVDARIKSGHDVRGVALNHLNEPEH